MKKLALVLGLAAIAGQGRAQKDFTPKQIRDSAAKYYIACRSYVDHIDKDGNLVGPKFGELLDKFDMYRTWGLHYCTTENDTLIFCNAMVDAWKKDSIQRIK